MSGAPPRILIVLANPLQVPFFTTLAGLLETHGAHVRFLSTDYTIARQAWKLGRRAPNVMHTPVPRHDPARHSEGVSLENVCRYVLAHPSLEVHYLTLFDQADRLVRAYGRHFDRVKPDLVLGWNGTIPRIRAAMKLAEARGIPTLCFEQGSFRNTLICDPKGVNYEGSMRDFQVPTDFNRERIDAFLTRFASQPRWRRKPSGFSGEALASALINFFPRRSPFHPAHHFDHDRAVHPVRFLRRVRQYLKLALGSRETSRTTDTRLPGQFIFLPLQVHDDTQIIVHSPLIRSMEDLVDETLEALPEGWPLVVKSHPADEGRRDYRVIEEMLEGPAHHFLRTGDTLELVKRSSCVVTVNSTVGLEALALGKPVVVLGDAVYAGRGITVDVHDLSEFPAKLAEAVTFRPDPDEVRRFLDYYIFEYAWPGDFRRPDPDELAPLAAYVAARAGCRPRPETTPAARPEAPSAKAEAPRRAEPLVSIVMPAHNTGRFIGQAIRSVLAQTYTRWELTIVDDGSTDNTEAVVSRFVDPRIVRIRTENRGPAAARNVAIARSKGAFVAFLDSDDAWLPDKLACQLEVFDSARDVGLVYTNVRRISEDGARLKPHRFSLSRLPRGRCLDQLLVRNGVIAMSTVMVRRAVLERVGEFGSGVRGVEDWDFWRRAAIDFEFRYVPRFLGAYRIRSGSLSGRGEAMNLSEREVISRAFSDRAVRRQLSARKLRRLRKRAEAVHFYNAGARALRAGDTHRAAACYYRSVRTTLYDVRQIIMPGICFLVILSLIDRNYLLDVVRK
ncbi:MAG TPA: glycosyltransferase [Planctomycetota bacterium]|nr:glycosyltransferase [Planctomycetota bacterium]